MTATVFVDTNVLVYWRDSTEPVKQARARDWLDLLWREQRGRTSVQVLSEFHVVLTRKPKFRLPLDEAWRDVHAFMTWNPQPLDAALMERAHAIERRYKLSWWDSLVVAAAQAQDCALLLTEDMQDGVEYGGVVIRNPFTLQVSDELSSYVAAPKLASRYRGRGRPRRVAARTVASS
jgi:predicted nucleic acid-binding protein